MLLITLSSVFAAASAHGFINFWRVNSDSWVDAQHEFDQTTQTTFRGYPGASAWYGANFLTDKRIACGAEINSEDPNVAPSGKNWAASEYGVPSALGVKSGDKVTFLVGRRKGADGGTGFYWPHTANGQIQMYLAYCGSDDNACSNADANTLEFFKIQQEVTGVVDTFKNNRYNDSNGHIGNTWSVTMPTKIKNGAYIIRMEIIIFGASSVNQGSQDQYYPYCGQIALSGGTASTNPKGVLFPGAYENGNLASSTTVQGPAIAQYDVTATDSASTTETSSATKDSSTSTKASSTTTSHSSKSTTASDNSESATTTDAGDSSSSAASSTASSAQASATDTIAYKYSAVAMPSCSTGTIGTSFDARCHGYCESNTTDTCNSIASRYHYGTDALTQLFLRYNKESCSDATATLKAHHPMCLPWTTNA